LIGTASIARSAEAATASALPGAGATFGASACDSSSGFATSSDGNCVRNFAAASRIAAKPAIASSSSPLPISAAGPLP